jgi:hypothetical protein
MAKKWRNSHPFETEKETQYGDLEAKKKVEKIESSDGDVVECKNKNGENVDVKVCYTFLNGIYSFYY